MLGEWLVRAQAATGEKTSAEIVRVLPHDPAAFTQGLAVRNGALFESTGLVGASSVRRVCTTTGNVLEQVANAGEEFGEDIAFLNDRLYQLTYKHQVAIEYGIGPIARCGESARLHHNEGWGLANVDQTFLVSDGSNRIFRYNNAWQHIDTRRVTAFGAPLRRLNAMTVRGNSLFVNIWYTEFVAEISLETFRLVRMIDCSALIEHEAPQSPHHILNGIAWDRERGFFWMTGKHWHHLFAVRFPESDD